MRRKMGVTIAVMLMLTAMPVGIAIAEPAVPAQYWPPSAPIPQPDQAGCTIFSEVDPMPLPPEAAARYKELEAKTGKPVVRTRPVKEVCFNSFSEYLDYMEHENTEASAEGRN